VIHRIVSPLKVIALTRIKISDRKIHLGYLRFCIYPQQKLNEPPTVSQSLQFKPCEATH